jgi:hypothetical protein
VKVDKSKIDKVEYSHEKRSLLIKFKDGSMHGENGNIAVSTMKQLNDNNIPYIDIDIKSKNKKHAKS